MAQLDGVGCELTIGGSNPTSTCLHVEVALGQDTELHPLVAECVCER